MKNDLTRSYQSRRTFLKVGSALSLAGVTSPFVMNLAAMGEAAASTANDYKALVCIFLNGGNDQANTVVPYDQNQYATYVTQRNNLAIPHSALDATVLNPNVPLPNGAQYALAPSLASLLPVFNSGKLAVMLNLGALIQPTTKAQYVGNTVPLPPRLFSHSDQQSFCQYLTSDGSNTGWAGRIGDLLQSGSGAASLTCISTLETAPFLTGAQSSPYTICPSGPRGLIARDSVYGSKAAGDLLISLMQAQNPQAHPFEQKLAAVSARAISLYDPISSALASAPSTQTVIPVVAGDASELGTQLQMVAKLISVNRQIGAKRQIFFVSFRNFDVHDGLTTTQPALLSNLGNAMKGFYDTTVELGVSSQVCTFTASEFGRCLTANNDGTDHGWGGIGFVMGDAVKGGRYYGINPVLANNGPDDVGQGRLVPTMAMDQYAATMATWFGVSASDLSTALPNINNFVGSPLGINVGFI